jgi:hypothetical protein
MHNVLPVVIQREAAMGQSKHPVAVGKEPGEQGSPAGGTGGRSTESFPKKSAFLRETLKIWSGH